MNGNTCVGQNAQFRDCNAQSCPGGECYRCLLYCRHDYMSFPMTNPNISYLIHIWLQSRTYTHAHAHTHTHTHAHTHTRTHAHTHTHTHTHNVHIQVQCRVCDVSDVSIVLCPQIPPSSEEVGHCDVVEVEEIGDTNVVVFRQGGRRQSNPL